MPMWEWEKLQAVAYFRHIVERIHVTDGNTQKGFQGVFPIEGVFGQVE
jgi:hypothetical protein